MNRFITVIYALLLTVSLNSSLPPHLQELIKTHAQTTLTTRNYIPADISFLVADIKYDSDKKILKFCEMGSGIYASIRPYKYEHASKNDNESITSSGHMGELIAPCWNLFWHYLTQFKLPIFYVGEKSTYAQKALGLSTLSELGGVIAPTLNALENDLTFQALKAQPPEEISGQRTVPFSNAISQYKGIVVYRAPQLTKRSGAEFKLKHPEFLYVSRASQPHIKSKTTTHALFENDPELAPYYPISKVYPKQYTKNLAKQIIADLGSNMVVIKPLNATYSLGTLVIDKDHLDEALQMILVRQKSTHNYAADHCFSYWPKDPNRSFMVSQYCLSTPITLGRTVNNTLVDSAQYDPVMRVLFVLTHDQGTISMSFLGGFWKIPKIALNEVGTLTQQHVTIAGAPRFFTGIPVEPKTLDEVKTILLTALPKVYSKMLVSNKG